MTLIYSKLRPEERAIWDAMVIKDGTYMSYPNYCPYESCMLRVEKILEARDALIAREKKEALNTPPVPRKEISAILNHINNTRNTVPLDTRAKVGQWLMSIEPPF